MTTWRECGTDPCGGGCRPFHPSACVDVLRVGRDAAAAVAVERHYRHIIYLLGKKKNTTSEQNR